MNSSQSLEPVHTRFWQEIAEDDDPFAAAQCRCAGYDVYGDLLPNASWIEYLYLLFHGEQPTREQAQLLDSLALAIANPGPRDCSVQAAMTGGAGGSTLASCLMAALAVGAGGYGGAREVYEAMLAWQKCRQDFMQWRTYLEQWPVEKPPAREGVWPSMEHPPGFVPHGKSCPSPVRQTLANLSGWGAKIKSRSNLAWLQTNRLQLEAVTGLPLAMSGVASAALTDLDFEPQQGEMLYLLLRLPGAAAHALEQHWEGNRNFPFYRNGINLINDPGPVPNTDASAPLSDTTKNPS